LKGKKSRVRYVSCISCGYKVMRASLKLGSLPGEEGRLKMWTCPKCGASLRVYEDGAIIFRHKTFEISSEVPSGTLIVDGSEEVE
jgi:ribosomal protein S26